MCVGVLLAYMSVNHVCSEHRGNDVKEEYMQKRVSDPLGLNYRWL